MDNLGVSAKVALRNTQRIIDAFRSGPGKNDDVIDDTVVVDRDRFERLRAMAEAEIELNGFEPRHAVDDETYYRWRSALRAIQPGDLDPLP